MKLSPRAIAEMLPPLTRPLIEPETPYPVSFHCPEDLAAALDDVAGQLELVVVAGAADGQHEAVVAPGHGCSWRGSAAAHGRRWSGRWCRRRSRSRPMPRTDATWWRSAGAAGSGSVVTWPSGMASCCAAAGNRADANKSAAAPQTTLHVTHPVTPLSLRHCACFGVLGKRFGSIAGQCFSAREPAPLMYLRALLQSVDAGAGDLGVLRRQHPGDADGADDLAIQPRSACRPPAARYPSTPGTAALRRRPIWRRRAPWTGA